MQSGSQVIPSEKVLIVLLDADNCIYNSKYIAEHKNNDDGLSVHSEPDLLHKANEELFDYIARRVNGDRFTKVVVMCGSNRQSHSTDSLNMRDNKTGLFHLDLSKIQQILAEKIKDQPHRPECILDPVLLADVCAKLPFGKSHERVERQYSTISSSKKNKHISHAKSAFDRSKLTWHYFVQHYAVNKYGSKLTTFFMDDVLDIHKSVSKFYKSESDFLPEGVRIEGYPYCGVLNPRPDYIITGSGPVDRNFVENTRLFIQECGARSSNESFDSFFDLDREAFRCKRQIVPLNDAFAALYAHAQQMMFSRQPIIKDGEMFDDKHEKTDVQEQPAVSTPRPAPC